MPALVLVIDDDPAQREILERMLGAAGYRVATAVDGAAGVEAASALRPDLVVCDIMMPRMNGFQTLRALRRDPALAGTPFVFLTSKDEPSDHFWADETGASAYLTKPVQLPDLLGTLRQFLPRDA